MTKTYRIRTTPGDDKNIRITINQDVDFLEFLS
jgi:2-C-methyl-D-erythritol 4-phosphate cytidylyltransferase